MTSFDHLSPTRVVFGNDVAKEVPTLAAAFGKRAFVVTGSTPARHGAVWDSLASAGFSLTFFSVAREPTVDDAEAAARRAREAGCDWVLAVGGGAAIDCAKAASGLLTNPGGALDYLEVVGLGKPLTQPAAPLVALPTTAGAGAEVTRNAVLASPEHRVKASLRSPLLYPRLAVIDPALALRLPAGPTASSGLDAITQLIEPFVSKKAQPFTDALCREGLRRAGRAFPRVMADPRDLEARGDMALAAMFSGICLANAALGAVHGLAGVVGAVAESPHGAVCARLLPGVIRANLAAEKASDGGTLRQRYAEVASLLTDRAGATAEDAVAWAETWVKQAGIPGLATLGLRPGDIDAIAVQSAKASSMKGNPFALSHAALGQVLRDAL